MRSQPWMMPVLASLALPMTLAAAGHARADAPAAAAPRPVVHRPTVQRLAPAHPVAAVVRPHVLATHVARRLAVARPVTPRARHAVRPTATRAPHPVATAARTPGPTGWSELNAAITRIPSYRLGGALWVVSSKYGHWGTADWYHDTLYVAPSVPNERLYDVAVHEWSHELSALDYGGDVDAATAAMNAWFGGSGLVGAERAADCMARLQGATWTHYTDCNDSRWPAGAARLVKGGRL